MHNVFSRLNSTQQKRPSTPRIRTQTPRIKMPTLESEPELPGFGLIQEKRDQLENLIRRRSSKETVFNPEIQVIAPTGLDDAIEIANNLEQITMRMTNLKRRMTPDGIDQKKTSSIKPIQPIQPIQKLPQRKASTAKISRKATSKAMIKLPGDLGLPK